jgi:hypothetical protein
VVRCAQQDGASLAGLLVTTEAMIAELPNRKRPTKVAAIALANKIAWAMMAGERYREPLALAH